GSMDSGVALPGRKRTRPLYIWVTMVLSLVPGALWGSMPPMSGWDMPKVRTFDWAPTVTLAATSSTAASATVNKVRIFTLPLPSRKFRLRRETLFQRDWNVLNGSGLRSHLLGGLSLIISKREKWQYMAIAKPLLRSGAHGRHGPPAYNRLQNVSVSRNSSSDADAYRALCSHERYATVDASALATDSAAT